MISKVLATRLSKYYDNKATFSYVFRTFTAASVLCKVGLARGPPKFDHYGVTYFRKLSNNFIITNVNTTKSHNTVIQSKSIMDDQNEYPTLYGIDKLLDRPTYKETVSFCTLFTSFLRCCGRKQKNCPNRIPTSLNLVDSNVMRHAKADKGKNCYAKNQKFTPGISPKDFIMQLNVVLTSFIGLFLLAISMWTWARRLFVYTYFMEITLDTTYFLVPAGFLCFPCFLLTILLKTNRLSYLFTLIAVHIIATALLLTGHFQGTVYKLDYSNTTERLSVTIPKEPLNHTLYTLIANYEKSPKNYTALDRIHKKFECCGAVGKDDFVVMPHSCCPMEKCWEENEYLSGCLRSIQADVAWHVNISSSLIQLLILLHVFNLAMALNMFVSDRSQFNQIRKARKRQRR